MTKAITIAYESDDMFGERAEVSVSNEKGRSGKTQGEHSSVKGQHDHRCRGSSSVWLEYKSRVGEGLRRSGMKVVYRVL